LVKAAGLNVGVAVAGCVHGQMYKSS